MNVIFRITLYSSIVLVVFLMLGFHEMSNLPTVILSSIIFGIVMNLYRAFFEKLRKKAEKHHLK